MRENPVYTFSYNQRFPLKIIEQKKKSTLYEVEDYNNTMILLCIRRALSMPLVLLLDECPLKPRVHYYSTSSVCFRDNYGKSIYFTR